MSLEGEGGGFIGSIVGSDPRVQQAVTSILFGVLALPFCFKRSLSELRFVHYPAVHWYWYLIFDLQHLTHIHHDCVLVCSYVSLGVVGFSMFTCIVIVSKMIIDMSAPNATIYNARAVVPDVSLNSYASYLGVAAFGTFTKNRSTFRCTLLHTDTCSPFIR
mgnify:CR=1 FL=1